MKYEKAQDILPTHIIELIQEYIDGSYLYIPQKVENKKTWGEVSGSKNELKIRNIQIFEKYNNGCSIKSLMKLYYLSENSIRRIIREQKKM